MAEFAMEGKRIYGSRCNSITGRVYFFWKRNMLRGLGKAGFERVKTFTTGILDKYELKYQKLKEVICQIRNTKYHHTDPDMVSKFEEVKVR